ncbi:IS1341-type transposase [Natronococcus amylolyticus DSM 10524]|uniref:IS1341-type transposase n=1 Tax=Natronococcus amylolyticus DSM 10524 TaxID=1227497 RepID=L9XEJ0_9EURY|nr:transposase [Natronococcus amylolyticus]ELY60134.1 IS1341-type transposase [Natronococcus amylolyticus DSM 10524]
MSDRPRRTNEYTATPTSERYKQCLFEWLVAHAPLWNQINYRRLDQYFDPDGNVWDAEYTDLYDKYAPVLGKATCQQVARKNADAWRSHFDLLETYHSDAPSITEKPSPTGFKGNRDDGYELYGLVRNDLYEFDWDEHQSTLEFGVGEVLEEKYDFDHNERITLEVRGNPQWDGDDAQLELVYDEAADTLRVKHPVRIRSDRLREQRLDAFTHTLDPENTMHAAAIDVGANNTLAIVTTTGETAVYHARPEFERFQALSELIAELQSQLPADQYTSPRIQRVYERRGERRDHSRDAGVKHAADWLLERNVCTVYVGDLTGVLETHWSAVVNEKTHAFWSHRQLVDRLELMLGDVRITVEQVSEAESSSACPECGSENVSREGDLFRCRDCALDAHSDVVGAWNLLQAREGPMARPAALSAGRGRDGSDNSSECDGTYWEWDGHDWRPAVFGKQSSPVDQPSVGKPASSQPG